MKKRESGFIYVVQMEGHPLYKIGRSANVPRRMSEFGVQLPFPYRLLFAHRVPNMYYAEADLHKDFASCRRNGEWFELPPSAIPYIQTGLLLTQAYTLADNIVTAIGDDACYSDRLKRYGQLLIRMSTRVERRVNTRYACYGPLQIEMMAMDALSAEFIG